MNKNILFLSIFSIFLVSCTTEMDIGAIAYNGPVNLHASDGTLWNGVHVTWSPLQRADGYLIYRSISQEGPFTEIGSSQTVEYIDESVGCYETNYYQVKAVIGSQIISQSSLPDSGFRRKAAYVFHTNWGSIGTGELQFTYTRDIAINHEGNLFITEEGGHRVQVITTNGVFVKFLPIYFGRPVGIICNSNGDIFVSDPGGTNTSVFHLSSQGYFIHRWGTLGSLAGQLNMSSGICSDTNGNIYIAEQMNHRIQKFDTSYVSILTWGSNGTVIGAFDAPRMLGYADGLIYVSDRFNNRIQVFNENGTFIRSWGSTGSDEGQFLQPAGIAIDRFGDIYVVDSGNSRVQKFTPDGQFLAQFGTNGSLSGELNMPYGLTIGNNGDVYIADSGNNRIQVFRP